MKKVIAIVVTYKRKELLERVLTRLSEQSFKLSRVLVVDNNSQDGTEELVKTFYLNDNIFEYYNTGANLGGAGGFNYGFQLANNYEYDYLWLMDDDFLPAINCLDELISVGTKGIIQPIRFNLDGSCAEITPVVYDLSKVLCTNPKSYTVADIYNEITESEIEIAAVPFEGPLISKDVVKEIGFPESNFFIFNDDLDYSIRARKAGFKITCSMKATAERLLLNNQKNDLKSWKGYFMLRNHFYILRTHGENVFVKNRSLVIALFYILKSLISLDSKTMRIVINAYKDSFKLSNNDNHKPG
ncbi:TPA: glycosyltransferase family 2 protein [Photobacterium damselae]